MTDKTPEIHKILAERRSPRAFADRPVEMEKLTKLFEAARWAASSFNEQPWRFIAATKEEPEKYERLFDCLSENNQAWADNAPLLMLTVAKKTFSRNDKPNRHALHDVGLAMGNFSAQATALGLYLHQMAGFSVEKAQQNLDIPEDYQPVAMVALGYLGDPQQLPEKLRERENRPRTRKPLEELVFSGRWGETLFD